MKQSSLPCIDPFLFEGEFQLFRQHVLEKSGAEELISFSSNPYTEEEDYKYEIQKKGRANLNLGTWVTKNVGEGKIAQAVIRAIELPGNNLVSWQPRYGPKKTPHYVLKQALDSSSGIAEFENVLYDLYRTNKDEATFHNLVRLFGRKYPLIAYLYFLKDRSRYMPIAPDYFDRSFKLLGADFITSQHCSWENYTTFNHLLSEIKLMLSDILSADVSLLDAHSFTWMLSCQMAKTERPKKLTEYAGLTQKAKEAIIQARRGQGRFRKDILDYWLSCAVTKCGEQRLLIASHIKPWRQCDLKEAVDLYNGLLLIPSLDTAFDAGFISFSDDGEILLSDDLADTDAKALGIDKTLKLCRTVPRHHPYLKYHRENVFRKANE